jgi:uncharacterized protein involved in outer membrane biogenesis
LCGTGEFEGDTLVSFSSAEVVVDLISAIKMEDIKVKRIIINNPRVHAWVLPNGKVNWDIVKDTGEEETDTTTSEMNMKVALKRFEIKNGLIRYDDDSSKMTASLENFNFAMTGDLSQDFSALKLNSNTENLNFIYDGIRYLKDAALDLTMDVDADLKNSLYTLRNNSILLNDLALFGGSVGMPNEDIMFDLKYGWTGHFNPALADPGYL